MIESQFYFQGRGPPPGGIAFRIIGVAFNQDIYFYGGLHPEIKKWKEKQKWH